MEQDEITREVCETVADTLDLPRAQVGPELSIRAIPTVESMKILSVIVKLEKRYGIEIPDEATFTVSTVGELVTLVERLCTVGAGATSSAT